ncbi:beta-lactamase regulating signal transducer with metallopeptidase domain [Duganella sp. 1224]|uniref:M56 family metallopeptidase n=1 Tax=Duganella sp. 1224 TaxID=2587052 RepID=UPI0015C78AE4|nr:M56 family metallopeptidase [Duganella sp. 1224]NYE60267.1 beta-lactamase regulating signal transducer with metallopeptidase domain [Duganella sp. 1224]
MANDILRALLAASLVAGAVILLLCAIRLPLRRAFGAQLAYLAWAAVPAAMLAMAAASLSAWRMPAAVQQAVAPLRQFASAALPAAFAAAGVQPWQPWESWLPWLVAAWLAVAVAMLAWHAVVHRRYRRQLGPLRHDGGIHHSTRTDEGPTVVGLWRPIIVVPADFAARYTPHERQLILAHEAVHMRRRDPLMNALCALTQCALWFHPLVHLAARRFRLDQELACDAAVVREHPTLKRSYADAMLKTQMPTQAALIHCHWQSIHPLKERIMQLQHTPPSKFRRAAGRLAIAALVAACGYGGMAVNAASAANAAAQGTDKYMVKMKLNAGGETSAPALLVQEGVPAAVASGAWRTELLLTKAGGNSVFVKTVIKHDGQVVSSPALLVPVGEAATVAVDDQFKLRLAVSKPRD